MVKTIGNPLSWGAQGMGVIGTVAKAAVGGLRHSEETNEVPKVRQLTTNDIWESLRKGFDDFAAFRTDVFFLVLLYPVIGMALVWLSLDIERLPMIFPLIAGFALLGPVAAVGLYELSRRREAGESARWGDAFSVFVSPALSPILVLGAFLFAVFIIWLSIANAIYNLTLGPEPPAALLEFVRDVLTTQAGWVMIIVGCAVGFVFALLVLVVSLVSFPMLVDRPVGLPVAVVTSVRAARANPKVTAIWGIIVAVSLAVGSLPFFLGLIVVLPVLGHATFHLYRRAVEA